MKDRSIDTGKHRVFLSTRYPNKAIRFMDSLLKGYFIIAIFWENQSPKIQ